MFCSKCGREIADDAVVCVGCGRSTTGSANLSGEQIPNYLVQSVLATVLCCMPFGVVAIIQAGKVNSLSASGDLAGAREASRKAKNWCWIACISGAVCGVLYLAVTILSAVSDLK